ncbi:hypothetical protein HK097_002721 [Rhizophlyctis rosea]|uniref:Uncharacterized protein n=1 Tax=Rhizophlyctis rosea TaxID=64517 RepID=A0AAD5S332_9FUNG|nr:hypothetical protein HK097_002721 [Rhizophlyctis rosea]
MTVQQKMRESKGGDIGINNFNNLFEQPEATKQPTAPPTPGRAAPIPPHHASKPTRPTTTIAPIMPTPVAREGWITGTRSTLPGQWVDMVAKQSSHPEPPADPTSPPVGEEPHPHHGHHRHHHHYGHHHNGLTIFLFFWIMVITVKLYKLKKRVQEKDSKHGEDVERGEKKKVHFVEVVSKTRAEGDEERLPLYTAGVGMEELRV